MSGDNNGDVKRLYRSTEDKMLAGVCGGLGAYFDIDPTLVRVIFIVLALIGLGGVILYLLLWVLIPPEPEADILGSIEIDDEDAPQEDQPE